MIDMKYSIYFTPRSLRELQKLDHSSQQRLLFTLTKVSLKEETRCEEKIEDFKILYFFDKKRKNLTILNLKVL
ncbi:MAG: hypothetical protein DRJ52_08775 [Thermoprotei archaeon]|nr:MAG: hypothetical protein DRJ52_08775 [Thermoprotei archaeon]RLE99625.1 MAG: hypothetical protein DRJ63_04870 [Thermoprotei archaeon]